MHRQCGDGGQLHIYAVQSLVLTDLDVDAHLLADGREVFKQLANPRQNHAAA